MATENSVEGAAELAGAEAAHSAERAVENAVADVSATIERVEERAEAAEELNEVLTEAAHQSAVVRTTEELISEQREWIQGQLNADAADRASLRQEVQSLTDRLSTLELNLAAKTVAEAVTEAGAQSTPTASPPPSPSVEVLDAEGGALAEVVPADPPAVTRRKRII